MSKDASFRDQVYELVRQIPEGRVMTYGQIAALCGRPRAARMVGQIAHFGPIDLPWQRVIKKSGDLVAGFPGGREGHKQLLEADGVAVRSDFTVNVDDLIWWPETS